MNKNIALLKGLISIIKRHWKHFTAEDFYLLREIKYLLSGNVINRKKVPWDKDKHPRNKLGQFAKKYKIKNLTKSELETLKHAATGLQDKEIGEKRTTTEEASKRHMKSCYKKLNAVDRTDAVIQAIRYGIIDPNDIEVKTNTEKEEANDGENTKLSKGELNVLRLAAIGCKKKQMAKIVGNKECTPKQQMHHAFKKLAVDTRTAGVIKALQDKLITIDEIVKLRNKYNRKAIAKMGL